MIGIITILKVNNYGAELQAFALQNYLADEGFNTEIIDYVYYKNPKHISTRMSRPFVKLSLIQNLKEKLYPILAILKSIPYYKAKLARDKKFDDFHKKFTKMSKTFRSMDALYNEKHPYDIFIVGSDQVWNPYTNSNIEPYFLKFAPTDSLKIAYASSFGVDSIPIKYHSIYSDYLNNLSAIGVREKTGVKIVNEIAHKNASWVLDPTFLLTKDKWEKYSSKIEFDEPYILLYVLTDADYITKLAKSIAKERGLKIVRICKNSSVEDNTSDIYNVIDAGPSEYLGWFINANYVLTTSFHGTCFSLNFNKSFNVILKREKLNNSRQIDLLKELGIEERIIYVENKTVDSSNINYQNINEKLDYYRKNSFAFLNQNLKNY